MKFRQDAEQNSRDRFENTPYTHCYGASAEILSGHQTGELSPNEGSPLKTEGL